MFRVYRIVYNFPLFPVTAKKGIRSLTLQIDPAWVRRGESIQLFCNYDMESNPLYSVKWYRGTLEFYRYSPFENPPEKTFPFSGIKVDVSIDYVFNVFFLLNEKKKLISLRE